MTTFQTEPQQSESHFPPFSLLSSISMKNAMACEVLIRELINNPLMVDFNEQSLDLVWNFFRTVYGDGYDSNEVLTEADWESFCQKMEAENPVTLKKITELITPKEINETDEEIADLDNGKTPIKKVIGHVLAGVIVTLLATPDTLNEISKETSKRSKQPTKIIKKIPPNIEELFNELGITVTPETPVEKIEQTIRNRLNEKTQKSPVPAIENARVQQPLEKSLARIIPTAKFTKIEGVPDKEHDRAEWLLTFFKKNRISGIVAHNGKLIAVRDGDPVNAEYLDVDLICTTTTKDGKKWTIRLNQHIPPSDDFLLARIKIVSPTESE